ncbi:pilus assembly FimT family protein [Thermovibrio sp.]
MKGRKGFTLIEAIVILIIVAVLSSLALHSYSRWKLKTEVERDVRTLETTINKLRMEAFSRKRSYKLEIVDKSLTVKDASTDEVLYTYQLLTPFGSSSGGRVTFTIDRKGIISVRRNIISKVRGISSLNPDFDCISVGKTYVRVGRWNGTACK